jgi:hypothetical protein
VGHKTHKTDVPAICQTAKIFTRYSTVSFTCPFLFSINNKNGQIKPNATCNTSPEAHPGSCTTGTGSLLGQGEVKRPRRHVNHPPHPELVLKKEHSCASNPPMRFHDKLNGEIYLYSIIVFMYSYFYIMCIYS